jgi:hypothetical protein
VSVSLGSDWAQHWRRTGSSTGRGARGRRWGYLAGLGPNGETLGPVLGETNSETSWPPTLGEPLEGSHWGWSWVTLSQTWLTGRFTGGQLGLRWEEALGCAGDPLGNELGGVLGVGLECSGHHWSSVTKGPSH